MNKYIVVRNSTKYEVSIESPKENIAYFFKIEVYYKFIFDVQFIGNYTEFYGNITYTSDELFVNMDSKFDNLYTIEMNPGHIDNTGLDIITNGIDIDIKLYVAKLHPPP